MGGPGSGKRSERPSTAAAWHFDVRPAASWARRREREYGADSAWGWALAARDRHPDIRLWLAFDFDAGNAELVYTDPTRPTSSARRGWSFDADEVHEVVQLVAQPCGFGGERWLARCPGCDRAVAVLWLRPRGRFTCRRCAGLVFATTRLRPVRRAFAMAAKLPSIAAPSS